MLPGPEAPSPRREEFPDASRTGIRTAEGYLERAGVESPLATDWDGGTVAWVNQVSSKCIVRNRQSRP